MPPGSFNRLTPLDEKRAQMHGLMLIFTFGFLFVPSFTLLAESGFRFAIYLLPAFSFLFWLIVSPSYRLLSDMRFIIALVLYAMLLFSGVFFSLETIDQLTWINALRPVFYLAAFIPLMVFDSRAVKLLVVIFGIATFFLWITGSGTTRGEINLEASQGPLESGLAFPLGGILIYFLVTGRKRWSFITFVLFFIAFKRIAFAAVLIVLALMLLNKMLRSAFRLSEYKLALMAMICVLAGTALINIFYFDFFNAVSQFIGGGESVSEFTMGRLQEFDILYQQYGDLALANLLFGHGAGDATRRLVEVTITYPLQVHNSFLLYFYDFGVVGFAFLLLTFLVIFSRTTFGLYLFIYNLIIMVTDNTFTHHYHQITYFVLIAAMQYEMIHHKEVPNRVASTA